MIFAMFFTKILQFGIRLKVFFCFFYAW